MLRRFLSSTAVQRRVVAAATSSLLTTHSARFLRVGDGVDVAAPQAPASVDGTGFLGGMEGDEAQQQQQHDMGPAPKPEQEPKYFTYTIQDDGITVLSFNRPPVNSLSLEMLQELNEWLSWMGDCDEVKSIIFTSSVTSVFSAGLDIQELYKPEKSRLHQFWSNFQQFFFKLHTFPKPTIAAVNGNSPAGGCIIALGCDYRIMAKHPDGAPNKLFRIGLNETKLGLIAPPWVMASLAYVVGRRVAERMLQLGETPTAVDALKLGLVDEVVDLADLNKRSMEMAKKFMAIEPYPRWLTRDMMRGELLYVLAEPEGAEHDIEFFMQMIESPDVQKSLESYLERLKSGGKKK